MSEPPIDPPADPPAVAEQTLDPLTHGDVVPYAKRGCRLCTGTGEFNVLNTRGERTSKLCGCALRRFLKRHAPDTIREAKTGRLYWLPGRKS